MPSIKEPDLALAGLALLVIFGLLIWYDRPVESVRPFDPYIQHQNPGTTGYAYESRFWGDPFAFDPPDRKEKSKGYCEKQLIEEITAIKNPVKILAPLLKVRPNTPENSELRTRHRYAVIAGLIESGYRPLKPGYRPLAPGHRPLEAGHLHFCSSQKNSGKQEYDVRWEHYSRESQDESDKGKSDVIVVWMNSEIFIDNNRFRAMSENLLGAKEIIKNNFYIYDLSNILDQGRSAQITREINNINLNKNYLNENIKLFKPRGTDEILVKKLTDELKLRNIKEPSEEVIIITEHDSENARTLSRNFREALGKSFDKCKPGDSSTKLQSTVDGENAEGVACEIRNIFYLKGLDAYQQIAHNQDKNEEANKQAAHFSAIDLNIPQPLPIGPSQFDYFHRLAKQINDPHKAINLDKRDSGIKAVGIFGSDFYDKLLILDALRSEMPHILVFTTDLDAQMLHSSHWLSTRNLVVASNFNLLLKEEYQKQFPPFRDSHQTSIFFHTITTVTDHVKNLENSSPQVFEIGRTGFTRLPHEKNEDLKYHPPDNTLEQTEWRLALLSAIIIFLIAFLYEFRPNSGEPSLYLLLYPLAILGIALFVGISKPGEPLNLTDGVSLWPTVFIQIIVVLLAFAFVHPARRDISGEPSLYLLLYPLAILGIALFVGISKPGEPLNLTDGVSLWPTIFIQISVVLLAFAFVRSARRDLDRNFCDLSKKYFTFLSVTLRFPFCAEECKCKSWFNPLDKSSIPPLILLVSTIFIYAWNEVEPSGLFYFWVCLGLLVPITWCYLRIVGTKDFVSIKDWMEEDNCPSGEKI